MLARDLMTQPIQMLPQDRTLGDAARLLIKHGISGLAIIDGEGMLVGIITSTDFSPREATVPHSDVKAIQLFQKWLGPGGIEAAYQQSEGVLLSQIMRREVVTATEDTAIDEIAALMIRHDINHVPVVREGRPVGMITRHDFLRLAARA